MYNSPHSFGHNQAHTLRETCSRSHFGERKVRIQAQDWQIFSISMPETLWTKFTFSFLKQFFSILRWISSFYIKHIPGKSWVFITLWAGRIWILKVNQGFCLFVLKIYHLVTSGRNKNSFFLEVPTTSSSLFHFSDVAPLNTIFYSKSLNNMNGSQKINKHPNNTCKGFIKYNYWIPRHIFEVKIWD